jgi:hypothetical protein
MMCGVSNDDSNLAQAYRLLTTLQAHIIHLTKLIEEFERQRAPRSAAGRHERDLRRESSEVHGHISRIHERFPETREN